MILGFTGTRSTEKYYTKLLEYLGDAEMVKWLDEYDGFVTGGCRGFDALIGYALVQWYPEKRHVVLVPWDMSQVDSWWLNVENANIEVYYMPEGTDYRFRNTEIVRWSDFLFYCADYDENDSRSKRSGTWMTVRIAQKQNLPYDGIVLSEELV